MANKVVIYEFPIKIQIDEESNVIFSTDSYDGDKEGLFSSITEKAKNYWDSENMIQYLDYILKDLVLDMKIECDIRLSDNKMFCNIVCKVVNDFTDEDSMILKNWIVNEMSNGWGERFKQKQLDMYRRVEKFYGQTYVHIYGLFWWEDDEHSWTINRIQ